MAYLKLWIDPRIITSEQMQLPEKVVVGTNPDDSDKYNLTITKGDSLNSSTWAEEARFLLTPDPEIGHMPVKTDEGLKYLLVESNYVGYNNYWTFYAASKLWFNVLEDSYGKFIRFGSNTKITDYWETLAQTYKLDDQGNKDYYLFPKCGIDRGYGRYWHYPSSTYIRSMLERDFTDTFTNNRISYTNDNGEVISRCPYTGIQKPIYINTETEGGAVCITTRINIEVGSTCLFQVLTSTTSNPIDFTINRSEDNKYTITVPYPRNASSVSGGTTKEIPNFDPTIPHRYVFIHRPNKILEVWVDHVQYKKEDGSDIYYQKSGVYNSYDWTSYIWGYNKFYYEEVPVEDLYEFKLYQGELEYEDTIELTASITASRNPVVTNVPSLSTSTLTCNVDGIIDRNQEKYSKYKEVLDSYIDCTGDYVKYVNVDGTEVVSDKSTINNEYFNLNTKGSWNIGEHTYHASVGKSYLWEETSQIVSIGNLYTSLMYTGEATGWNNEMHIYPTINNKYVIKTPDYTSEELDGLYDKHTYKLYAIYGDIRPGYLTLILYRDGKEVKFYDSDGNLIEYNQIYMNANSVAAAHTNRFWIDLFHTYDKYNQSNNSTNFYSRKVYNLLTNTEYEEYPELTYLWNTGETTKQITVQPTVPTTYSCTVTQGTRTANASILIDTVLEQSKPIAVISPQEKPYIEHMIGRFYATNSYDINDPVSPIVKYIWNDVETVSPVFVTRVKRTDKIRLKVVNALGLVSDEVEVDLSKDTDQWGNRYKFLDIPMFLICSKGANLFDTLISRFPIPTNTLDLYSNFYPTEYDKYTSIGFTTDISTDTIKYMACLPHHGVAEYTANREQVDIYPLGISWLEKRNMIKYYNKVKGSKGSLMACLGHPEIQEEGYGSLEFVLDALGIITPKERYTIPRLLDLLELLLMDYDNGGLQKL